MVDTVTGHYLCILIAVAIDGDDVSALWTAARRRTAARGTALESGVGYSQSPGLALLYGREGRKNLPLARHADVPTGGGSPRISTESVALKSGRQSLPINTGVTLYALHVPPAPLVTLGAGSHDTNARWRLEIPIRHIGQNSTRIEHELQLNMWPHGMKTVSRAETIQILHICCSRTCSSTCRRT